MTQRDPLLLSSLEKSMVILMAFAQQKRPMTLSALAKAVGLNRSSVQRSAYTFVKLGYLDYDAETKLYRPAPRCLELANGYLQCDWLTARASPFLRSCHNECEETVNLSQLVDTEIMLVNRLPSQHVVSYELHVGSRAPAYCTAPGRAILAHMPDDVVDKVLAESKFEQYTPHTVTDPDEIRALLAETRAKGYALQSEELMIGDLSAAAPVLNAQGQAIAAVNVAVPTSRWTIERLETEIVGLLIQTARAITNSFAT